MTLDLTQYKTIIFDGHGVILDSNITKMDAYFRTAKKLGATNEQGQALIDYHLKAQDISREDKFIWYLKTVLNQTVTKKLLKEYLDTYSLAVNRGLMNCRLAEGLNDLKQQTIQANWVAVTTGDQEETRLVFSKRAVADLFDGGIFGGPDSKKKILIREQASGNIQKPALFLGDGEYDYECALDAGLDFVFLSAWTALPDWERFCIENKIDHYKDVKSIIS